jgi:hypothetical protein
MKIFKIKKLGGSGEGTNTRISTKSWGGSGEELQRVIKTAIEEREYRMTHAARTSESHPRHVDIS